jgi:DNA-binding IclR family transcriptional regulator
LNTALGRAIIAFAEEHERNGVLKRFRPTAYTPHTITSLDTIRKDLELTRKSGISYVRDEYRLGVIGFAAPVFNVNGRPIASIGVALSSAVKDKVYENRIRKLLLECAANVSKSLGANLSASPSAMFRTDADELALQEDE